MSYPARAEGLVNSTNNEREREREEMMMMMMMDCWKFFVIKKELEMIKLGYQNRNQNRDGNRKKKRERKQEISCDIKSGFYQANEDDRNKKVKPENKKTCQHWE